MSDFIAEHIAFSYRGKKEAVPVLSDVSFELKEGEGLCLLGASGTGKTTLLKILAGFLNADKGSFKEDGNDVLPIVTKDRDVAYMFQDPFLYPHMSVYENLIMGLSGFHLSREERDARVKEMLIKCGLEDILNLSPKHLSLGQKQMIALSRSLIREPSLFLADEPFSALDPLSKTKCMSLLFEFARKGKSSIIYATHHEEDTLFFPRAARLENGKLHFIK